LLPFFHFVLASSTDYTSSFSGRLFAGRGHRGPRLWAYEVRNSVLMGLRRGRIGKPDSAQFLSSLNVRVGEPASYDDVFRSLTSTD
jgi:hypothetical protein